MNDKRYQEICDACGINPGDLSRERAAAVSILASGQVPPNQIRTRKAPGGKILSYFPHYWANQLLIEAYGPYGFSYEVLETTFYDLPDGVPRSSNVYKGTSATARVKLTIYKEVGGRILSITTTVVGVFRNDQGYNPASACASAASMGLAKCLIRRYGFLLDRYSDERDDRQLNDKQAWAMAIQYSEQRGVTETELVAAIKSAGIVGNEVAARYDEIWQIIGALAGKLPEIELPAALDDTLLPEPEYKGVKPEQIADVVADASQAAIDRLAEELAEDPVQQDEAPEPKDQPAIANWGQFYAHVCKTHSQFSSGSQVLTVIDAAMKVDEKKRLAAEGKWNEIEARLLGKQAETGATKK